MIISCCFLSTKKFCVNLFLVRSIFGGISNSCCQKLKREMLGGYYVLFSTPRMTHGFFNIKKRISHHIKFFMSE